MKNRCRKTTPFTLIELLVVIGIIAILASMVMPAMGRTRDSAKTATCISNHKQIASFLISYMSDFSGYYPPGSHNTKINGRVVESVPWIQTLYAFDYMPEPKQGKPTPAVCPNGISYDWGHNPYIGTWGGNTWGTVGMASYQNAPARFVSSGFRLLPNEYPSWKGGAIRNPSSSFLHGDSIAANERLCVVLSPWGTSPRNYIGAKHNNKQNTVIGFADGHVESLNRSTLKNKYEVNGDRILPKPEK